MTGPSPYPGDPLWSLSAHEIARLVRERGVPAVEVVTAHLERIKAVNPRLNAVVQLDVDRALEAASAADRRLAAGHPARPLEGVPFTAKDNLETAGIVTAIGVVERAATVPDRDATAVARLKAAGAILLGKTNCPPWGGGSETENDLYGRTNNPFGPCRDRQPSVGWP